MSTNRTAVLIRTHENNSQVRQFVRNLNEHVTQNVYLVCDQSGGPIDFGNDSKLSLSPEVISR